MKKRILLLTSAHPKEPVGLNFAEKRFPLGVGFLISAVRNAGHSVEFYDRYLTGEDYFPKGEYDYVGIYSNTPCFKDTLKIIEHYNNKTKIIVGGPHTSIYPETLVGKVDYVVQGEGEDVIVDILADKVKTGIIRYPRIIDLDRLPLPSYDIFQSMPYTDDVLWFEEKPVWNMNTSRGCPYNCSFCNVKDIWGHRYTCFSANRVFHDIKYLVSKYNIKGIYFREDNFTCNKKRVFELCDLICRSDLKIKWVCETRVDNINDDIAEAMADSGCKAFYVGFESGSQRMLDIYNKQTTVQQGLSLANSAHKYGIAIAGSFIKNHPDERPEDELATQNFIKRIRPRSVWINKWRNNYDSFIPKG